MRLAYDMREKLGGGPGLHALIVGISQYRHLPGGSGPPATFADMQQLSSAARSAHAVYHWLIESRERLPVPLASVRLLLSPSQAEAAKGLAPCDRATMQNALVAAGEWREDTSSHKDNVALFYFAGHGLEPKAKERALLLEDFGDGVGAILRNSLNFESLHAGMARFKKRRGVAGTQLYFVDACRVTPAAAKTYHLKDATPAFEEMVRDPTDRDDRLASIFYATREGDKAYGYQGGETLFNRALIDCLDGWAGVCEEVDGEMQWCVTLNSLSTAVRTLVGRLGKDHQVKQEVVTENIDAEMVIRNLDCPPPVALSLQVAPDEAVRDTTIEIMDITKQPVLVTNEHQQLVQVPAPLDPHPFKCTLPAGYYFFNARVPANHPTYRSRIGDLRLVYPFKVPSKFVVS